MLNPASKRVYIGSTTVTMTGRNSTRKRKIKQLQAHEFVSCESAARHWNQKKNFHLYTPIVYRTRDDKESTLAAEATDISIYQPQLNHPFINKFLRFNKFMRRSLIHKAAQNYCPGQRFLHRLRLQHRHREESTFDYIYRFKKTAYALGSKHLRRFYTMRKLWGNKISKLQLYTLLRLTQYIDEPYKSKAIQSISWRYRAVHNRLLFPSCTIVLSKNDCKTFFRTTYTSSRPNWYLYIGHQSP